MAGQPQRNMGEEMNRDKFDAAMEAYLEAILETYRRWYKLNDFGPHMTLPEFKYSEGTVNAKVICTETFGSGCSVHSFVRLDTGDILKPAGWKAPAKGVRGSIFSDTNGGEALSISGCVRYNN